MTETSKTSGERPSNGRTETLPTAPSKRCTATSVASCALCQMTRAIVCIILIRWLKFRNFRNAGTEVQKFWQSCNPGGFEENQGIKCFSALAGVALGTLLILGHWDIHLIQWFVFWLVGVLTTELVTINQALTARLEASLANGLRNHFMQKFASIGASLDHVLSYEAFKNDVSSLPLRNLLKQIAIECERGEAACQSKIAQYEPFATETTFKSRKRGSSLNEDPTKAYSVLGSVPSGLRFAILDDSPLVRQNLLKTVQRHFQATADSFATGSRAQECSAFVDSIIQSKVGVAIVDENLDYEDASFLGTKLAESARERGFCGCLIRYSSQPTPNKQNSGLFDGLITKTSNSELLLAGMVQAWEKHVATPISPSFA